MESTIRYILLLLGVVIVAVIFIDGLRRRKRRRLIDTPLPKVHKPNEMLDAPAPFLPELNGDEADVKSMRMETLVKSESVVDMLAEQPLKGPALEEEEASLPTPASSTEQKASDDWITQKTEKIQMPEMPARQEEVISLEITAQETFFYEEDSIKHQYEEFESHAGESIDSKEEVQIKEDEFVSDAHLPEFFFIKLIPKKVEREFGGYVLLQTLLKHKFHFGEDHFFHYYGEESAKKKPALFSLAAGTQSGEFDLSKIRDFSCKSLVLYFDKADKKAVDVISNKLFETAKKLARDLNAKILNDQGCILDL